MEILGVVLRLSDVSASRSALEQALGCSVDWASPRHGSMQHAQIPMIDPEDAPTTWADIQSFIELHANKILALIDSRAIRSARLDIGVPIYEENLMSTVSLPHELSEVVGRNRIGIDITLYATASEDGSA
ncbi:MAG: hypothetical protein B7Z40_21050 [Bosea sp. 12-68-7]|nr:MAG: hypothetical protein B7Z40_21050 [Bosea sp. 12-68-7]